MSRYVVYNAIEGDYEQFDYLNDAKDYLNNLVIENQNCDIEQLENCKIFIEKVKIKIKVVTDNENSESDAYDKKYNQTITHKFLKL